MKAKSICVAKTMCCVVLMTHNEVNLVASSCAAAACPAVYEDTERYIVIGKSLPDEAVPQHVEDDEQVVSVPRRIVEEAVK